MYTLKVDYEDFNGEMRAQTLYFNISKIELSQHALTNGGSVQARLKRMLEEKDNGGIFNAVIDFIDMSYGVKSDDGLHFRKSPQILDDFKSSPAYEAAVVKILTDETAAQEFITRIMPKEVQNSIAEAAKKAKDNPDAIPQMLEEMTKGTPAKEHPVIDFAPDISVVDGGASHA